MTTRINYDNLLRAVSPQAARINTSNQRTRQAGAAADADRAMLGSARRTPAPAPAASPDPSGNRTYARPGRLGGTNRDRSGGGFDALLSSLFGNDGTDFSAQIGDSYDAQIAALMGLSGELGGLTDQLIGNINSSASATNNQIGGFFGYAADQANAGRPVIQETGATAQRNVDAIYDQLGSALGALPAQSVAQASAAAGSQIGGSVAGRVAAAAAPFAAAGETSRANAKANMVQHSAAGQDYLSQLAAAAPSEAALAQGAVSGRANQAVTEAQMALAQQRAQISSQTAALEGAKQRAMIEHSADMAGSTFDRLMKTTQLYNALGADTSPLLDQLGLQAAPGGGMDRMDQLRLLNAEMDLDERLAGPQGGLAGFQSGLSQTSPTVQRMGQELLNLIDSQGLDQMGVSQLLDRLTNDDGFRGDTGNSILGNLGRRRNAPRYENKPTAQSLEDLLADPDSRMWTSVDPGQLRDLTRILFS
jgi:hypothetical protein